MGDHPIFRPESQLDVQRLLGRCMLRIQQYERTLKALLAHHELAGPLNTLEAQRSARVDKVSDKSLGTLVKALFETYVVADSFEREALPANKTAADGISMAFSTRMTMPSARWAETKAAVEDLVALRNELVHHLIEKFDLWTEGGCAAASQYLREAYQRVDQHYIELATWVKTSDEARSMAAQFFQSSAFQDFLVDGISPDGSVDWLSAGIARALREAATKHAVDGWTRLDDARAWIAANHPEQMPEKYGCRSWPQVLTTSRLFELQYRAADDGRKIGWYRERRRR